MSGIFKAIGLGGGGPSAPAPLPPDDSAQRAQAARDAERAAIAERNAAGRRSTIAAGGEIAADEQYGRGLLASKRRSATRETLGL